ncbi:hypothetical protein G3M73_10010 [Escherichia coli]|uniref:hypothetical protein n=1 Tax=Escherichia coli TaxID=562 RepID=UPI0013A0A047|nr:hypothetical protein [Escherichia coli]QIB19496.1 hypothetical protein G3M73_10010 [Escherichia coli]
MTEEFSKKKLLQGVIFTLLITIATGLGNVLSAFFMLDVKKQETEDNRLADARRRATELHCTKLEQSASLATEIVFRADRGYPNTVTLADLNYGGEMPAKRVSDEKIEEEQRELEHKVFGLLPYLLPDEAQVLEKVTLQHIVVTGMRTSKVPVERRAHPSEGGFDFNNEINELRSAGSLMGQMFREKCMSIK